MPNLLVIRHSLADANEQGILMGQKLNSPLSAKGIALAKLKGQKLKEESFVPSAVYTSELARAKQTAEIILSELGLNLEVIQLKSLNERDFGEHDGKPYKSVLDAFEKYGHNPPTIEKVEPFVNRVIDALELIKKENNGTTLVVSHSNPVMVMQAATFNPETIYKFWELGDPTYCEGFITEF